MAVNRIQIKASVGDKSVTVPIGQTFEEVGQEELIKTWEEVELQDMGIKIYWGEIQYPTNLSFGNPPLLLM